MTDVDPKEMLKRLQEGSGFVTQSFGSSEPLPEEEGDEDFSEGNYHLERIQRQMLEAQVESMQQRIVQQQAHIERLEKTLDQYQGIIDGLQKQQRPAPSGKSSGFGAWASPSTSTPNYQRAKESAEKLRQTNREIFEMNQKRIERQRKFREYSHWLYMTKATNVSFEDWLAGRYVVFTDGRT